MRLRSLTNSRHIWRFFAVCLALCGGLSLFSQAQSSSGTQIRPLLSAAPNQPVGAASSTDPTRAEIQPSLSIDRDPIPSPDAEETSPSNSSSLNTVQRPGELQKDRNGVYTLHEDVDEVLLNCTVIDEKGRAVMNLTRDDFHIWEDNVPQATTSFRHQDLPVSMGILVDNSGSMHDKRPAVNAATLNLFKQSNRQDAAFVVNFSDRAFLDQGFTSDIAALNRGLSHFDSRGTTALYDAVAASADQLAKYAKQQKQVLLIVSDGADNASRLDLEQAVRRVQNLGGPVVYTIGLLYDSDQKEYQRARIALDTLSAETGGVAYFPPSLSEVDRIAAEVAQDIRNQYTVGYHSTKPANQGGYRFVHVEATSPHHGKLIVRTRRGYYAKSGQTMQSALQTNPNP